MLLVDAAHERSGGWQDLIDEDEDSLLGRELYALADYVDELTDGEIGWNEVLLLVNGCDVALLMLLTDDWDSVAVFLEKKHGASALDLQNMHVIHGRELRDRRVTRHSPLGYARPL